MSIRTDWGYFKADGTSMADHGMATLMRLNGLRPTWRRKCVRTTDIHLAMY